MTYKRNGDQVTLEMDIHHFNWLLILLGCATSGSPHIGANSELFHGLVAFLNEKHETAKLQ